MEFGKLALVSGFDSSAKVSLIVPVMLFSSGHVKRDVCVISNFLQTVGKRNLIAVLSEACAGVVSAPLIGALVRHAASAFKLTNCLLVLVCRGGSDSKVNALAYSLKRSLWEGAGFA